LSISAFFIYLSTIGYFIFNFIYASITNSNNLLYR